MPPAPNPGRLLELSGAYWQTCALHAAVKLDLFTALGRSFMSPGRIAAALETDERAVRMLVNALTAMGLLHRDKDRYGNSEESSRFLDKASPTYQGHIILHHRQLMPSWTRLDEAVRTGGPVRERLSLQDAETREHFLMGMFNLAMGLAPRVTAALDLQGRRRLLDLGGGPGTYALHFCRRHPALTAVVFDLPETRPFAEKIIGRFELADRVVFEPGNYRDTPLPGVFDVIWISHILHAENADTCRELIGKAAAALVSGGLMVIHDFFLNEAMDGPLFPTLFALNMLLGTEGGQSYAYVQVEAMMTEAGLQGIERRPLATPNDSGLLIGTK